MARIMELTVVVWNACLLIRHAYNWMMVSNDEDCNQDLVDEIDIVDIGRLMAMDEDGHFDNVNVLEGSFAPMDWALACLHETMAKIIAECIASTSVELCNHATSLL